eukprot:CAMPEP_0196718876 /NCGR_PEP_ID=MMETSP1091-20130531/1948_1 /TAXON_ID=302021 /ORGANISM="Rhodomonas sp., Strain CCMP768" /LENGTH=327 /DNA_ID=CAMNT_0042059631 /DNA_START=81 /DNA_END=1064 /DNA_ORIENTATION=+
MNPERPEPVAVRPRSLGGLDVEVVELGGVDVLVRDEVARVLEELWLCVGDALERVSAEHAQRRLYPELVLLAGARDHEVDVERVLDDVSDLLDDEEHPAHGGDHRDHLPLQGVHEDERQREAPHGQEARGVARVRRRDRRLHDPLARPHDVAELGEAALGDSPLRDQSRLHHPRLKRSQVLPGLPPLPPARQLRDVRVALAEDGSHHLDESEGPVPRLPEQFDVGVAEAACDGSQLRLGQQRRAVDRLKTLKVLEQDRREARQARDEVVPLESGEVAVSNARHVTDVVHKSSPKLARLPETVIGTVRPEHQQKTKSAGGQGVRHGGQ